MSSFNVKAVLLHGTAASLMAWGFMNLKQLPLDKWIREQKGGHAQFLTILGLGAAWLTMIFSLGADVLSSVTIFRKIKRTLFMVAMPVAVIVSSVYWSLLLLAPHMILPPSRQGSEPTSSQAVPELARIPLSTDLALHASPVVFLILDFFFLEKKYSKHEATYGGIVTCVIAAIAYGSWAEWLASYNGTFPYPFLTESSPTIRKCIYAGLDVFAILTFWAMNALHS